MSSATARALLRHAIARPEISRSSYNATQATLSAARASAPCSSRTSRQQSVLVSAPSTCNSHHYGRRAFHASPSIYKSKAAKEDDGGKKGKKSKSSKSTDTKSTTTSDPEAGEAEEGPKHPQPNVEDPLDFSDVKSRLSATSEKFHNTFKKSAGRFEPDYIGSLKVLVDKKDNISYPLRDLAQVVPRGGRTVSLLVHEEPYVKAIMSAIQTSPEFNQQPQRDADNELELLLKIEPEKPEDVVKRTKANANAWKDRIKAVRQKREKTHDTWAKGKLIRPDAKKTLSAELEKIIKAEIGSVDALEKEALKGVGGK
ncbi:ribosome recycling factor [Xylariaceae sp. FL1019]|nr:ribosome recycling factor [Xylariaceae sp. FL1019]